MEEESQRPFFRDMADRLTKTRRIGSYLLGGYIVAKGSSFRSWKTAGAAAGLYMTDFFDGWSARHSNIPSSEGARDDEETDKTMYRNIMLSLSLATGDPRYNTYVIANQIRDLPVARKRAELRERGIKADSRGLGKIKTAMQGLAIVADLSPIGETYPRAVHAMHAGSVVMTAVSGLDVIKCANEAIDDDNNLMTADEVLAEIKQFPMIYDADHSLA